MIIKDNGLLAQMLSFWSTPCDTFHQSKGICYLTLISAPVASYYVWFFPPEPFSVWHSLTHYQRSQLVKGHGSENLHVPCSRSILLCPMLRKQSKCFTLPSSLIQVRAGDNWRWWKLKIPYGRRHMPEPMVIFMLSWPKCVCVQSECLIKQTNKPSGDIQIETFRSVCTKQVRPGLTLNVV